MHTFLKIFTESFKLAFDELRNNTLRSILSLLGITIGIFCIIAIFTGVDFLNSSVEDSFKEIGTDVLYVERDPWQFTADVPWWEYQKRRYITYENFKKLEEKMTTPDVISYLSYHPGLTVRHRGTSVKNVNMLGITGGSQVILNIHMKYGRFFSQAELEGIPVAIVGKDLSKEIFGEEVDPTGAIVKVNGKRVKILGLMADKDNLLGVYDLREFLIVPHEVARRMFKITPYNTFQRVGVKAKEGRSVDELKDEIIGVMRGARKLKPIKENDFAVNRVTMLLEFIKSAQNMLKLVGGILGLFSLLIGGFGIANIMFVSVRERTKYIGIKKAIGAKRGVILLEFLIEAIVLCLLGSIIGLLLVYVLALIANSVANLEFVLSAKNILIGIGISVLIGVVAGIIPAFIAAKMDPVKAIRS